jgi:hypothetical protein
LIATLREKFIFNIFCHFFVVNISETMTSTLQFRNRHWRQSADELTEIGGMSAAFWLSPCRTSLRANTAKSGKPKKSKDATQKKHV